MSEESWPSGADHPSPSLLLLQMEGELEGEIGRRVTDHVTHCWECRTECEHLRQGIFQYMEYQASETLPPPPSGRSEFGRRLMQAANSGCGSPATQAWYARAIATFRQGWRVAASAAAAAVVATVFLTMSSRNIAAGEVLGNAINASKHLNQTAPGRAVYQKILIRRGNFRFERTLARGAGVETADTDPTDTEAKRVMAMARINWADPLNAGDFSDWRAAQHSKKDEVRQSDRLVTVDTTSLDDGPVREASLTVERNGWRPVGRHVELRDGEPLDITEVSYEIHELPARASVEPGRLKTVPEFPARSSAPDSAPDSGPSRDQLEDAELRLREVLHATGADVRDSPFVWSENNLVRFRIFPESPQRANEVLHVIEGIPFVKQAAPDQSLPEEARTAEIQQLTSPFTTNPPLFDELTRNLGGQDNANKYLASVRESYARLLSESTALQRLGQRYSPETARDLAPAAGARIVKIASDHTSKINQEASSYLQTVMPVLADMMREENMATNPAEPVATGACVPWQEAIGSIISDAKATNANFMELFVQEQVEKPTTLTAPGLLQDTGRAATALRSELRSVCEIP